MQKWEYLLLTALFDKEISQWFVVRENDVFFDKTNCKGLNIALKDYGNQGWELVSECLYKSEPTYEYATFPVFNYKMNLNWETQIDKKKATYEQILDYLEKHYGDSHIVGCIPYTLQGTTLRFEILFEVKIQTDGRRFALKRPISG